jgi:predicted HTH domain antitoxin
LGAFFAKNCYLHRKEEWMTVILSNDLMHKANLIHAELRAELTLGLFETERLSFGQARRLAGVDVITFQQTLARNRIPLHYDVADFERDLATTSL